jgi:hypothetical protein
MPFELAARSDALAANIKKPSFKALRLVAAGARRRLIETGISLDNWVIMSALAGSFI